MYIALKRVKLEVFVFRICYNKMMTWCKISLALLLLSV
jgi:hypothetical protein